jgi:hypothetical protein
VREFGILGVEPRSVVGDALPGVALVRLSATRYWEWRSQNQRLCATGSAHRTTTLAPPGDDDPVPMGYRS